MITTEKYGKRRSCIIDGYKTTLILAYSGNPYADQWNQFDSSANIDKDDKKPVMHTAHSLPKAIGKNARITTNGRTYIFLD